MGNYLAVYDITGIQSYIFKTRKIKEISGASLIIRNYLDDVIDSFNINCDKNCQSSSYDYGKSKEDFIDYLNKHENLYIEYAFEGGGNLFIFFHGELSDLNEFNKNIQLKFLTNTGGLAISYSYVEIKLDDKKDLFDDYRKEVLNKLRDVKTRMPRNNGIAINPIMKLDSVYGTPIISKTKNEIEKISNGQEEISYESYYKLKYLSENNDDTFGVKEIDKLLEEDSNKNMIAVIHVDGNDLGSMINNYISSVKVDNFVDSLIVSREISRKIDYVFKEKIKEEYKGKDLIKMVLNSGDDITFISNAFDALNIVSRIIELISCESLYPEAITSNNLELLKKDNKFSACAGICYCHPHFPFYRAYEIAEELCSNAKGFSKSNRVETNIELDGKKYQRSTSWMDFEIVQSGILKSVDELRRENSNLYLRPYSFDSKDETNSFATLINNIKLFKNLGGIDNNNIARSIAKEIRNTYEISTIDTKILFKKLKSRDSSKSKIDYDNPYTIDNFAKYYDAVSLFDLYKEGE